VRASADVCELDRDAYFRYRLVAYIAHGRELISLRLPALNDSPPLSFTLLDYAVQLWMMVHLSFVCRLSESAHGQYMRLDGTQFAVRGRSDQVRMLCSGRRSARTRGRVAGTRGQV
jgi:hypothetical protein